MYTIKANIKGHKKQQDEKSEITREAYKEFLSHRSLFKFFFSSACTCALSISTFGIFSTTERDLPIFYARVGGLLREWVQYGLCSREWKINDVETRANREDLLQDQYWNKKHEMSQTSTFQGINSLKMNHMYSLLAQWTFVIEQPSEVRKKVKWIRIISLLTVFFTLLIENLFK